MVLCTWRKFQDGENFRPMSACVKCAGWHDLILFATALSFLFTVHPSCLTVCTNISILPTPLESISKPQIKYCSNDKIWLLNKRRNCDKGGNDVHQYFLFFLQSSLQPSFSGSLTLYHTIQTFNDPRKEVFRKHCGKRRKCCHFLLFSTMFSTLPQTKFNFSVMFILSSANRWVRATLS